MIHRYTARSGPHPLLFTAVIAFLAAIGFSNKGRAFVVELPPHTDHLQFVEEQSSAAPADAAAIKTLNIFCRAANLPHAALPAERVPAELALNPTDAKSTVDVIQQLSTTQQPVCSADEVTPSSTVEAVQALVDPIHHPHPLPAQVPPQMFGETSIRVQGVYGQVKANK